jgi:hypothetical protein
MFRMWGKIIRNNHILKDTVIRNGDYRMSEEEMIRDAVDRICIAFDLSHPIWLEKSRKEFERTRRTRFTADNFYDPIDFDYLEIQILEE